MGEGAPPRPAVNAADVSGDGGAPGGPGGSGATPRPGASAPKRLVGCVGARSPSVGVILTLPGTVNPPGVDGSPPRSVAVVVPEPVSFEISGPAFSVRSRSLSHSRSSAFSGSSPYHV